MEEKYYTKNRLDTAFEGNVDGFVVVSNEEGLIEEARAYDMSDHLQDELLSKIIQTVEIKGKPICIFADGLPVMDDVRIIPEASRGGRSGKAEAGIFLR